MINGFVGYVLTALIAYCLGSVSTGLLVAKKYKGPDLRSVGSKNTGATNVLRTMGWKYGLITFFGDMIKAILACLIGKWLTGALYGMMLGGLCVILGHNWPAFFDFKGGKGVASSCGVMLSCFPVPAVICFAVTILIIWLFRYISVGSMSMLVLYSLIVSVFCSGGDWLIILWTVVLAVLCLVRHHANIGRLLRHEENRFNMKPKAKV